MLKQLGRTYFVQAAFGYLAERYLALVRATTRFAVEPADFPERVKAQLPGIAAMWHGQHFMVHYAWPRGIAVAALISRHEDGEFNAIILERLGVIPVRGSGGGPEKMRKRGGMVALREMLRLLARGTTMVLTADVPKVSRKAGPGIIALAQVSGRPLFPIAVVSARRLDLATWDRASMPLPFGRGAMVLGEAIHVPRHADAAALEAARAQLEAALDAAHVRAYALAGGRDPGRALDLARAP